MKAYDHFAYTGRNGWCAAGDNDADLHCRFNAGTRYASRSINDAGHIISQSQPQLKNSTNSSNTEHHLNSRTEIVNPK
jgi:hypothetical protein